MDKIITWSLANQLRQRGLILNPEWQYESKELLNAVKRQYEAWNVHCETDNLIIQKAQEQEINNQVSS